MNHSEKKVLLTTKVKKHFGTQYTIVYRFKFWIARDLQTGHCESLARDIQSSLDLVDRLLMTQEKKVQGIELDPTKINCALSCDCCQAVTIHAKENMLSGAIFTRYQCIECQTIYSAQRNARNDKADMLSAVYYALTGELSTSVSEGLVTRMIGDIYRMQKRLEYWETMNPQAKKTEHEEID